MSLWQSLNSFSLNSLKYFIRSQAGLPDISLHVVGAWTRGIDGTGINVIVLDDGLDYTHPDLAGNYNPQLSYDFNDNDPDPKPKVIIFTYKVF